MDTAVNGVAVNEDAILAQQFDAEGNPIPVGASTSLTLVPDLDTKDEAEQDEEEEAKEEAKFERKSAMKKSRKTFTFKTLFKMFKKGELRFDLAIQRRKVWKEKANSNQNQKSLLVHSAMYGFPIPQALAKASGVTGDKNLWFVDGQQRFTTLCGYMNDEFNLLIGTPNVFGFVVEGKKFSDLPEEIRDTIESETIEVIVLEDATDKEIEEMFYRWNNGTALTKIEKLRSQLGDKLMNEIQDITGNEFFKVLNLTDNQRNGFVDEQIVLEILSLETKAGIGFTGDEIEIFGKGLRAIDEANPERDTQPAIDIELSSEIVEKSNYLNDTMKEIDAKTRNKKGAVTFLTKNNISPIYIVSVEAMKRNVSTKQFADFLVKFFKKVPHAYSDTKSNGTASKANVMKRIKTIVDHFLAEFGTQE